MLAPVPQQHQLPRILHRQQAQQHWSTSVKMAVFAPIPRASESTATATKTGDLRKVRSA